MRYTTAELSSRALCRNGGSCSSNRSNRAASSVSIVMTRSSATNVRDAAPRCKTCGPFTRDSVVARPVARMWGERTSMPDSDPHKRERDLRGEEFQGELLVYDLRSHQAHALNG